jgi:hypothetical protein
MQNAVILWGVKLAATRWCDAFYVNRPVLMRSLPSARPIGSRQPGQEPASCPFVDALQQACARNFGWLCCAPDKRVPVQRTSAWGSSRMAVGQDTNGGGPGRFACGAELSAQFLFKAISAMAPRKVRADSDPMAQCEVRKDSYAVGSALQGAHPRPVTSCPAASRRGTAGSREVG